MNIQMYIVRNTNFRPMTKVLTPIFLAGLIAYFAHNTSIFLTQDLV